MSQLRHQFEFDGNADAELRSDELCLSWLAYWSPDWHCINFGPKLTSGSNTRAYNTVAIRFKSFFLLFFPTVCLSRSVCLRVSSASGYFALLGSGRKVTAFFADSGVASSGVSCSRVLHQTFIIYVINIQLKFDILCNFSIQLIKCPPCMSGVTHFYVTSANCRPPHIEAALNEAHWMLHVAHPSELPMHTH